MTDSPFTLLIPQETPGLTLTRYNPPGLPALVYRPGTYPLIVTRMLNKLRKQVVVGEDDQEKYPLNNFNVLATDDWTVAFLRAWATVSDVLSFYQERIINEAYLRTAVERRSVLELTRAVGYELSPPVSAMTHLAFAVNEDVPGQKIPVPRGTAVQSVPSPFSSTAAIQDVIQGQPGPGPDLPVIFETTEDLVADPAWNALKPSRTLGLPWPRANESPRALRLAGSALGLKPGDALLVAGQPETPLNLPDWELLLLSKVSSQAREGYTSVEWEQRFGDIPDGGIIHPTVYVLRRKTALFPYVAGGVFRHTDLGWAPTNIGLPPKTAQAAAASSEGRLFTGIEQAVYASDDRGDSWQPITGLQPPKDVHAVAASPSGAVAVGTDDSGVHVSRDDGATWTPLSGPGEVEIPTGWQRIFASVRYKLPKTNIRSLLFIDQKEAELLAGSDDGVFGYDPRQDSWNSMNSRFPNLDRKKGTAKLGVRALAAADGGKRILAGTDSGVFPVESLFRGPAPAILIAILALLLPGALNALIPNFLQAYIEQILSIFPILVLAVLLIWLQPFRQKWIGVVLSLAIYVVIIQGQIARSLDIHFSPNLQEQSRIIPFLDQYLILAFLAWMAFWAALQKLPGMVQKAPEWLKKLFPGLFDPVIAPQVFSLLVDGAAVYAGTDQGIYRLDERTPWSRFIHWLRQLLFGPEPEPWRAVPGWYDAGAGNAADRVVTALALDKQGRLMAGTQAGNLYIRQAGGAQGWVAEADMPLASVRSLVKAQNDLYALGEPLDAPQETRWAPAQLEGGAVDVDALNLAIGENSYAAALEGDNCALFNVTGAAEQASHDAKQPGLLTRLTVRKGGALHDFNRARAQFFCQGEPLALFDDQFQPHPVQGDQIILGGRVNGLKPGKLMLISGITLEGQPRSEPVTVKSAALADSYTVLQLEENLSAAYLRESVTVYGNIVPAMHGQTIRSEYLGESDGTVPNQRFILRSPMAYEPAEANDYQSSLSVLVNKIPWMRVPTLLDQPADGRVYMVRRNDQGQTMITFGDGQQGARLPTSRENLTATYRSGGGTAGNLPPNSLTMLQSHLPHLKSVTNPDPARGGLAGESAGHGRIQAPHRLRALERIVTLKDYGDFCATFPGVTKSAVRPVPEHAPHWIDIAIVPNHNPQLDSADSGPLLAKLANAIDQSRSSAMLPYKLRLFRPGFFTLGLRLYVSPERREDEAWVKEFLQAVQEKILAAFSHEMQSLGHGLTETEIFQLVQPMHGVTAVTLTRFHKLSSEPEEKAPRSPLFEITAKWDELLLLEEDALSLEVA